MTKKHILLLIPLFVTSLIDTVSAMQKVYVDTSYTPFNSGAHQYGVDAFNTISKGVEAASHDATVYVAKGVYSENITIEKSLTLRGEGALSLYGASTNAPIIDGGSIDTPAVITITSTTTPITVTVTNFAIKNSGNGINVLENAFVTIQNNTINGYRKNGITFGPVLYPGHGGVRGIIRNNIIIGSGPTTLSSQNGIQISENNSATITENKISNHVYAVPDSWWASGILIHRSDNVFSSRNMLYNNQAGIDIMQGSRNKISKNSIYGNESTKAGITLSGSTDRGAKPTAANIIESNTIKGGSVGIWASNTSSNIYLNNKISSSTETGIYSWNGSENIFSKNTLNNIHSPSSPAWAIIVDGDTVTSSLSNTITGNALTISDLSIFVGQNSINTKLSSNTQDSKKIEINKENFAYTTMPGIFTGNKVSELGSGGMVLGVSTFNFSNNLALTSQGKDVTELQKVLREYGVFDAEITGYFGKATEKALSDWQKMNNIPVNGKFDEISRNILNSK
jgi:parallel beta-helix repeat protein